jgi:predicted aminopeptidase
MALSFSAGLSRRRRFGYAALLLLASLAVVPLANGEVRFVLRSACEEARILLLRRPIAEVIADPATSSERRAQLRLVLAARKFASERLGLEPGETYTTFADVGSGTLVHVISASPKNRLKPHQWSYPVVGSVPYKGFFTEADALAEERRLKRLGYDTYVRPAAAFSTLGWFNDPLLSTFINYPEAQVARLVFHELAHQRVYAKNDTTFNESFAVVVEEEGVRRWLESEGRSAELAAFQASQARKRELAARIKETRERLKHIYATQLSPEAMAEQKKGEFDRLRATFPTMAPAEPNNAFLVSIALYNELVPAFERLLAMDGGNLDAFYARAQHLAHEDRAQRDAVLARAN